MKSGSSNANDSKSGVSPDGAHPIDEAQQAADALDSYMKSNNSFVMDIFQVCLFYTFGNLYQGCYRCKTFTI